MSTATRGRWVPWLALVARLVTGGVWVVAGALKVTDPDASVAAVRAYEILPGNTAQYVGLALPAVELVVGLALVVGALTRGAALLSALLFLAFIAGIASVWARGIEIDCGCFGGGGAEPGATSDYPLEIARDVVLLGLSLFVATVRRSRLALDNVLFPTPADAGAESSPEKSPEKQGS